MIGYRISKEDLEKEINKQKKGWLTDAKKSWSDVKPVYMRLQGDSKCGYCERKLESEEFGKGEQAVDHFRPKNGLKAWDNASLPGVPVTTVPPDAKGYSALTYHPLNYVAACNPCNSILKRDFFPVAGAYHTDGDDPIALQAEELPYLIYPIGNFDENPEDLIRFNALSPCPVHAEGYCRNRALVTIAFFHLDDETKRKNLFRERALLISAFYPLLKANKTYLIQAYTSSSASHTNCLRSFKRVYENNPILAEQYAKAAEDWVVTNS